MSKEIKIHWICQSYVGQSHWHGQDAFEPDACNTEFITEDIQENWDEKYCSAICPNCGGTLTQKYDGAVKI